MIIRPGLLPGFLMAADDKKRTAIGKLGELLAYDLLTTAGYAVVMTAHGEAGDLRAIDPSTGVIYTVEVKTARRDKDGHWRASLKKTSKTGRVKTDHMQSDYVIFLCVLLSGRCVPFVIPTSKIAHLRSLKVRTHPEKYDGWLARYRQSAKTIHLG